MNDKDKSLYTKRYANIIKRGLKMSNEELSYEVLEEIAHLITCGYTSGHTVNKKGKRIYWEFHVNLFK